MKKIELNKELLS